MKTQSRDYTNGELGVLIENLCDKVDSGFNSVKGKQKKLEEEVGRNSRFRHRANANLNLLKWLLGFIGFGNIVSIGYVIMNI